MNNEPVAWIDEETGCFVYSQYDYEDLDEHGKDGLIPLYTHPVKEQDDYCKAYWGNNNKFVDVFLPNSETEVIRFWNNTHPVKEPTDLELLKMIGEQFTRFGFEGDYVVEDSELIEFAKAILRKAQEK